MNDEMATHGDATRFTLDAAGRATVKFAYATRLIPTERYGYAAPDAGRRPHVGDVVLGRVTKLGQHQRLHDCSGRRTQLLEDDLVMGVYGHRYATDQFEGEVPDAAVTCHILSIAGVCGVVKSAHSAMKTPTALDVIGFVYDPTGRPLNLRDFGLPPVNRPVPAITPDPPRTILVVGTAMNSGKTTTVATLVRGLKDAGYSVAAGKITGTACGNDRWDYEDHGATRALDFSDCGWPSTYLCAEVELLEVYRTLYHALNSDGPDFILVEIADGLLQRETAMLLANDEFRGSIDHLIYTAGDALSAEAGLRLLERHGYRVTALSGLVSASPLARREVEGLTGRHCYTVEEIVAGRLNPMLSRPSVATGRGANRSVADRGELTRLTAFMERGDTRPEATIAAS